MPAINTSIGRITSETAGKSGKSRAVGSVDVPEGNPLQGLARFISRSANRHRIKISARGGEGLPDNEEQTNRVMVAVNGRFIDFEEAAFVTGNQDVIDWLRRRIANGALPDIDEDISMLDIRCPNCEASFKNTPTGHKDLSKHVIKAHQAPQPNRESTDV